LAGQRRVELFRLAEVRHLGIGVREKVALAWRLSRKGASYREIARVAGCSPNTVWYLLGFGRLDPLDVAEFPAGPIGVDEAERWVRRVPGAGRVSGGPEGARADVVWLRLLPARALELWRWEECRVSFRWGC
jgi:hypothetical protein